MELASQTSYWMSIIQQPWHWSFSGFVISLVMLLLLLFNKSFGMSANLRTLCTVAGAGKKHKFFNFDWKSQRWNLILLLGAVIGGFLASTVMKSPEPINISESTLTHLQQLGVERPENGNSNFIPESLFNFEALLTVKGLIMMVLGGFLIGFGARWAGGCTSGHAISGLSNLQLPSLIAVIGFFIGGLLMTHLLLPLILGM